MANVSQLIFSLSLLTLAASIFLFTDFSPMRRHSAASEHRLPWSNSLWITNAALVVSNPLVSGFNDRYVLWWLLSSAPSVHRVCPVTGCKLNPDWLAELTPELAFKLPQNN